MPRTTLSTTVGPGPNIDAFQLPSGVLVPTTLLRGMEPGSGQPVDVQVDANGRVVVDSELPAAAVPADGDANSAIPGVGARSRLWDPAQNSGAGGWVHDRVAPGASTGITGVAGDSQTVTGTLGALNDVVTIDARAYPQVRLQMIPSGWTGSVIFEVSNDNANWSTTYGLINSTQSGAIANSNSVTSNQTWSVPVTGRYFRVRCSSYTAGTLAVSMLASSIPATPLQLGVSLAGSAVSGDGAAAQSAGPVVGNTYGFNGTTWDRLRTNVEGTALASAARTATTNSANLTNQNGRGVICFLNVSAASGTGGLTVTIRGIDPVSTLETAYGTANATPIITTGVFPFVMYPGVSVSTAGQSGISPNPIPRTWKVRVTHGDASSYTYSVGYCLLV